MVNNITEQNLPTVCSSLKRVRKVSIASARIYKQQTVLDKVSNYPNYPTLTGTPDNGLESLNSEIKPLLLMVTITLGSNNRERILWRPQIL